MPETVRFLLNKLPKKTLIETIIQTYEAVFPDPIERKEAFRGMALLIQANEILLGNISIDDFDDPFKSGLEDKVKELREAGVKIERVPQEELQSVCSGNHFDFDTGECKLTLNEKKGPEQCSKYPHCMFKIGEPVLRMRRE